MAFTHTRFLVLVLLHAAWIAAAPVPPATVKPIQHGPIALGNDAELKYEIDGASDEAKFELTVRNESLLSKVNERAWVAFGFGEPESGGYLGADLVSVEFAVKALNECRIVDRYIPFAAYPLEEGTNNASHFQAKEDK